MSDLVAFLNARLDEDEEIARAVRPKDWDDIGWAGVGATATMHASHNDPARVLREVAAKRAIIEAYRDGAEELSRQEAGGAVNNGVRGGVTALRFAILQLAQEWSDHPDYRQEWAP